MPRNREPGHDDTQAQNDRSGYKVDVAHLTGGVMETLGADSGMEVGPRSANDPTSIDVGTVTHTDAGAEITGSKAGKPPARPKT